LINNILIKRRYKKLIHCMKERDNILKHLIIYEPNFKEKVLKKYLESIKK